MSATRFLTGRTIVEAHRADASPVTQRAIATAGRIVRDLGATVLCVTDGLPQARPHPATDAFLNGGKITGCAKKLLGSRVDAVLFDGYVPPSAFADVPIKVQVTHGVPQQFSIADAAVSDTVVLALSGLLDLIGHPDQAPVPLGGSQAAGIAGLTAFAGMMAALAKLEASGTGDTVHVSAVEACLWSNWKSYAERLYLGRTPSRQGRLAEWQAVECTDGYATFIYLDKDWPAVCRMIGDRRLSQSPLDTQAGRRSNMAKVYDIVRPWYRARTRVQIYQAARAEGLPISPVLSLGEVLDDPQYAALNFFATPAGAAAGAGTRVPTLPTVWNGKRFPPQAVPSTLTTLRTSVAPMVPASGRNRAPLDGIRVLDLGIITAGASTSALLADLGADVIKVEASAYIDPFRSWDRGLGAPDWWNQSRFFEFTNRNKRAIALDLKQAQGKAVFLDLVSKSDVVVENFRRGVLERLGLGWDVLKSRNPKLIVCSITSQGEQGPEAGAASYGSTLEANSGLSDLTRDANGVPLISGILLNYPDQIVSIYAAGIVALAVAVSRRTGVGARLDISQRELATFLIGDHIAWASGQYDSDVSAPEPPRADLVKIGDGRWGLRLDDGHEIPVWNGDDLLKAVERGDIKQAFAKRPDGRDTKGMPFTLVGAPFSVARLPPELGQHNAEVLGGLLGLDEAHIAALAEVGVIASRPTGV